jgi:class 3 adenylate cyclase
MQCLECKYENRLEAKFCGGCGMALEQVCPNCNAVVMLTAKFCDSCGALVGKEEPSPTSANRSLSEVHVGRVVSEAERRQLTVMFCDLVGSTGLAERLDPEELRELLAQYQELCANVINKFEGYLARYIGDGLLVYFGYPQAHEDDPQRAVRAGLEITQEIQTLGTKVVQTEVTTAVRIGITTGLVVVGDIGSGEQHEEMAVVGETPNIAARLQTLAEPNTVVIGASTQSLVEGLFECKDLGPQNLKGVSKPLSAFHVIRATGVPSRFEASAALGLTPIIGREEEISLILKRWEQVKDGESQVVLLSGEAGIGKSRIVRGFQERITNELGNQVLYHCSPYYQNSAFYPLIDQLERALRFERNDSNSEKLDKLEAVLSKHGLSAQGIAPILANLLSLPRTDRYPELTLSPQELKHKTLEAIISIIKTMAAQNPVLMVVEDAHWIDPSTKELISLLVEQGGSTRVLLLITHRPEFTAPWIGPTNATALTLNRLSRKESIRVIARVTQDKALPLEVLDQIVAKTDGVPLFVEELTKNMLESGLLEEVGDHYALSGPLQSALAIPASLHDSLMARLDRLAQVKEIAQLAAALGRSFSHELLGEVSQLDAKELQAALDQLIEAELLFRRKCRQGGPLLEQPSPPGQSVALGRSGSTTGGSPCSARASWHV